MSLEKKIIITSDASGAESAIEGMANKVSGSFQKVVESVSKAEDKLSEVNKSIEDQFEELHEASKELFKSIVQDSEEYGSSIKERGKFIDQEIRKLREVNKEEEIRSKLEARKRYEQRMFSATSDDERKKARRDFEEDLSENNARTKMAEAQIRLLKQQKQEYLENSQREEEEGSKQDSHISGHSDKHSSGHGGLGHRISHGLHSIGHGVLHGTGAALGFGALFSIGGFVHKLMHEGEERSKAEARAAAMGLKSAPVLGLKTADAIAYSKNIALATGSGDVSKTARDQSIIERGTGMELGSLTQFQSPIAFMEREKGKNLADVSVEMLSIMKKSGLYNIDKNDFTMMHELMSRNNQLIQLESQKAETVSTKTASQLMSAFGLVGGSFGDMRQTQTLGTINNSIVNPGNDFKNAFIMRSIMKNSPDSSLLDVMMSKEEGIFKQGQFSGIMKDLFGTFEGDQRTFSISKLFGLNLQQSKKLQSAYEANPAMFDNVGSTEEVEKLVTKSSIQGRGGITQMEVITAKFDDTLSKWGATAIHKIEEIIGTFQKGGFTGVAVKITDDISKAVIKGFEIASDKFSETLKTEFDGVLEALPFGMGDDLRNKKPISGEDVMRVNNEAAELIRKELGGKNSQEIEDLIRKVQFTAVRTDKDTPQSILDKVKADNPMLFATGIDADIFNAYKENRKNQATDMLSDKDSPISIFQRLDEFSKKGVLSKDEMSIIDAQKKGIIQESSQSGAFFEGFKEFARTGQTSNSHLSSIMFTLDRIAKAAETRPVQNYATTTQD